MITSIRTQNIVLWFAVALTASIFTGYGDSAEKPSSIDSKAEVAEKIFQQGMRQSADKDLEHNLEKALASFRIAAALGHIGGRYRLGLFNYLGAGMKERNVTNALTVVTEVLINVDEKSRSQLVFAILGTNFNVDAKALDDIRKDAENDETAAIALMGVFHATGLGTKQNFREAEKWLRKATDEKRPDRDISLLVLRDACIVLADATGEPSDEEIAASKSNDPETLYRLGMKQMKRFGRAADKAEDTLKRAADLGHAGAKFQLGALEYLSENENTPKPSPALKLISETLKTNDEKSKHQLLEAITGKDLDITESTFATLLKDAENGDRSAQLTVSVCYATGLATKRSFAKASEFYLKMKDDKYDYILSAYRDSCAVFLIDELIKSLKSQTNEKPAAEN